MTDHEARAREVWRQHGHLTRDHMHDGNVVAFISAIASALREAEAGERREIMNLLGYDENGDGLKTTSEWLVTRYDPDVTSGDEQGKREVTISHDPYYNLEGALIDLRRQGADEVCIRTIERVQAQLAAVSKRAAAIRSTTDE